MRRAKWTTMLTVVLFLLLALSGAMAEREDPRFISPSKVDFENWMTLIPDEALITEINIPGTHDSGTAHMNWALSDTMASCHDWTIAEQLEHGLRVFDIRLAVDKTHPKWLWMELSHSVWRCAVNGFPNSPILTFQNVIADCASFLRSHGNETIVLCLSSEDLEDETRPLIAKLREEYRYTEHKTLNIYDVPLEVYVSGDPIPVLGHARGRIIVIDDESKDTMVDKTQGARFSYEMHYHEDSKALRTALQVSAATPISYAIAREAYFADVISLKKGFMNKFFEDAESERQEYTGGHGTNPGIFVDEGFKNEEGQYGEPGLKYSGTNLNTAGNYLGPLSPTIREYALAINSWLKDHAWKNGARYGWVTMDYPIDALTKNIIATNEIITTKVFVKGVWGDGFATRPDIGDEFIIDGKKYVRDYEDALALSPETAGKLENGALTLELAPSSPLYSREYPVTTRIEHVGMDYWEVWVYPEVRVTIDWDYVSPLDSDTLKDGFFIAKYENGDEVPVTASHVRVQKNEKDGSVVYLNVQPMDNKRGEMTLDINPAVLAQHKAYKYNAATDRVKRNEYGTNWGFTLRTSAAQYDFTGKITFNDNNNANGLRPGHTFVYLVATGHAPGRTVSDEDPVIFREYQQLEINNDQPTWIFRQLPMWIPNSDGSKQYDLNWELSFGNAGGYIVDIDYSQIQNHRIDSIWTAHPTSSVEIRWEGDETDTSYRPDKIQVVLRRKSTGERCSYKYVSPSTQWRTSFTSINDDDWTLSLSNVPVYYEAAGPFVAEDKMSAYFVCTRRENTQIKAKLHWYDGKYYGSHPAVNVSLLNGTTVVDKYEAGIYDDNNTAFFGIRPTKDDSGKPITYTVQAELVNNSDYMVYVQGFDIILIRKHAIEGFISWFDAAGTQIERPDWITDDLLKLELWRRINATGSRYALTDLKPTIIPGKGSVYFEKYDYGDLPSGVAGEAQHSYYLYDLRVDASAIPGVATAAVTESKNIIITMAPVLAHVPFMIRVSDNGYHPANEFTVTLKDANGNPVATRTCAVGQNVASTASQLDFMVNSMNPGAYSLTMEPVAGENWTGDSAAKSIPLTIRYNAETNAVEAVTASAPEFNVSYKHVNQPVTVAVRFPVNALNESQSATLPDTVFRFVPSINGKQGDTLSMRPGETICLSETVSQPGEVVFTVDQNAGIDLRWKYDTATHILRVGVKDNGSGVLIPDYADGDELAFENIYVGSNVHVSGLVIWDEEGVQDHALRPKEVTLELVYYYPEEYMKENGMDSADIQVLDTKVVKVTSDDCQPFDFGWREHITPSGELKFYAVREKPIDYYKTTMNYNGYSVLNVFTTTMMDIGVKVVWVDNNPVKRPVPERVAVTLLADGVSKGTVDVTKPSWSAMFPNMPAYRDAAARTAMMVPVIYTANAEDVPGFTKSVSGNAATGFTITYIATKDIPKTGDAVNLPMLVGMLTASLGMMAVLLRKRRNN